MASLKTEEILTFDFNTKLKKHGVQRKISQQDTRGNKRPSECGGKINVWGRMLYGERQNVHWRGGR